MMNGDVHALCEKLEARKIFYTLQKHRDEFIMICAVVPGERWEIEISRNGEIEIEVFKSDGHIHGNEKLRDLFERFGD